MKIALIIGYSDDLTAEGDQQVVASDYLTLQKMASEMGLKLNVAKCEVITNDPLAVDLAFSYLDRYSVVDLVSACRNEEVAGA